MGRKEGLWQSFGPEWRSWADILSVGLTNCLKQFGQGDEDTESLFFLSITACNRAWMHLLQAPSTWPSAHLVVRPDPNEDELRVDKWARHQSGLKPQADQDSHPYPPHSLSLLIGSRRADWRAAFLFSTPQGFFFCFSEGFTAFHWEQIRAEVGHPEGRRLTDWSHFLYFWTDKLNPLNAINSGLVSDLFH